MIFSQQMSSVNDKLIFEHGSPLLEGESSLKTKRMAQSYGEKMSSGSGEKVEGELSPKVRKIEQVEVLDKNVNLETEMPRDGHNESQPRVTSPEMPDTGLVFYKSETSFVLERRPFSESSDTESCEEEEVLDVEEVENGDILPEEENVECLEGNSQENVDSFGTEEETEEDEEEEVIEMLDENQKEKYLKRETQGAMHKLQEIIKLEQERKNREEQQKRENDEKRKDMIKRRTRKHHQLARSDAHQQEVIVVSQHDNHSTQTADHDQHQVCFIWH